MHDIDQYLIDWQFLYVHMWFFNAWSTSKNLKSPRDVGNKRWKNFWSNKNCNSWKWMAYIIMVFVFYMGWVPPISDCPFHVDRIVQFYLELLSHSTVQEWRCMNHVFLFILYSFPCSGKLQTSRLFFLCIPSQNIYNAGPPSYALLVCIAH